MAETSQLRRGRQTSWGGQTVGRLTNRRAPAGQVLWHGRDATALRQARTKTMPCSLDLPRWGARAHQPNPARLDARHERRHSLAFDANPLS